MRIEKPTAISLVALLWALHTPVPSYGAEITLPNGKRAVFKDDGTWHYTEGSQSINPAPADRNNTEALGDDPPIKNEASNAINRTNVERRSKGAPLLKHLMNSAYFWRLKYYFVAQNTKNCEIFYGLVKDDPFIGYASVNFSFPNGCTCHGNALVTHYPLSGGTAGQGGYVHAKCTDGRTIKGKFTTTSLTRGYWDASDSLANSYQGSFGHTAGEALDRVNALRHILHCPECTPREVELKVQGRILPERKRVSEP